MAVCHNCSAKILPGQRVCKACGEPVERPSVDGPDPLIGRTIADNFEISEWIGEGAMGRVYKARQVSLDKPVAIKVLHNHLANDPKVVRRFHREARAASRLSHPSSLHIIDFGEDSDGTLYIAMELLDGDDLLTVIEHDAPFTPRRIGELLKQVLSALDAAHHANIIHRDLKPENVVVLEDKSGQEHVKVCDFGIAKIQEAEGGSAITVTGFVCGTPEYMAPEQARGEELDRRADIYAAGCMLYQMLTASLPFTAESALGIITKHLTEDPIPPGARKPEWKIPAALEDVTLKAMAKDPDRRYQDAAAMSRALEEAIASLGDDADRVLGKGRGESTARVSTHSGADAAVESSGHKLAWAIGFIVIGGLAVGIALVGTGEQGSGDSSRPRVATTGDDADAGSTDGPPDAGTTPTAAPDGGAATSDAGTDAEPAGRPSGRRPGGRNPPATAMMDLEPVEPPSAGQDAYEEGRRRFLANDIPGAIRAFEQAARAMPRNPQVQKQLGRAYMRAGDVGRGAAAYRRYLELAPNATDRAIIERMIERAGG